MSEVQWSVDVSRFSDAALAEVQPELPREVEVVTFVSGLTRVAEMDAAAAGEDCLHVDGEPEVLPATAFGPASFINAILSGELEAGKKTDQFSLSKARAATGKRRLYCDGAEGLISFSTTDGASDETRCSQFMCAAAMGLGTLLSSFEPAAQLGKEDTRRAMLAQKRRFERATHRGAAATRMGMPVVYAPHLAVVPWEPVAVSDLNYKTEAQKQMIADEEAKAAAKAAAATARKVAREKTKQQRKEEKEKAAARKTEFNVLLRAHRTAGREVEKAHDLLEKGRKRMKERLAVPNQHYVSVKKSVAKARERVTERNARVERALVAHRDTRTRLLEFAFPGRVWNDFLFF